MDKGLERALAYNRGIIDSLEDPEEKEIGERIWKMQNEASQGWISTRKWMEVEGGVAVPDPSGVYFYLIHEIPSLIESRKFIGCKDGKTGDDLAITISTVFLALNHNHLNWNGERRPLLYETMIFGEMGPARQWRYATRESAEIGHQALVKALQDGFSLEAICQIELSP